MGRLLLICLSLWWQGGAVALEFSDPLTVAASEGKVFHHLDSSGRQALAANRGRVALVWEDNSDGQPRIWMAFKDSAADAFSPPLPVSSVGPAYEPVVAACGSGFLVGWEAGDSLWLRFMAPDRQGEPLTLSGRPARHLSLNETPGPAVAAVWTERRGRYHHVVFGRIPDCGPEPAIEKRVLVDRSKDKTDQFYPSVVVTRAGTLVGWEDRRAGATRIFTAFAPSGQGFGAYRLLNQFKPSPRPEYGRGTGAMRLVLSTDFDQRVLAVWLDKREFEGGYDVYADLSRDGGRSFDGNELVQDEFGQNIPQWHAAGAMDAQGRVLVAWDDTRDDSPDIWFSEREGPRAWSDDQNWPGGAGPGAQTAPVLLFDGETLHAAWVDRSDKGSAIRYVTAR